MSDTESDTTPKPTPTAGTVYDNPNQEAVRADGSGPGVEETPPPPEGGEDESYDPSAFTVDEVRAYVDAHPEDRDAITKAERKGKGRATLLAALEDEDD